jgi:CHASE3 domain sensor protein
MAVYRPDGNAALKRKSQDFMDDERILRVLEEIRDLQQQSASNYQVALHNQQESIRLQQTGLRRVRIILALATGALILAVGMLVMLLLRAMARLSCPV